MNFVNNEIEEINAEELDPRAFKSRYWATNSPVLIKGAIKHWPAYRKWRDPNYLVHSTHNPNVRVRFKPVVQSDIKGHQDGLPELSLSDFLEVALDGTTNPVWVGSVTLLLRTVLDFDKKVGPISGFGAAISDLAEQDFGEFSFLSKTRPARLYPSSRLFLYRNSFTDWHPHATDSHLLCQICGSKEVLLFAPNIGYKLFQPVYDQGILSFESSGSISHSILESNPMRVVVGDGDALHIPVYWYHSVRPTIEAEFGISLVHAFASPLRLNGDFRFDMTKSLYKSAPKRLKPLALLCRLLALLQRNKATLVG